MRGYRSRRSRKATFSAVCLLLAAVTVFLLLDARVRPLVRRLTAVQAKTLAAQAAGQGVETALAQCRTDYASLAELQREASGRVVSVQMNALAVNQVRASVNRAVTAALADLAAKPLNVPIGSLTGLALLNGRGPRLPVLINVTGSAESAIENRFESAGANQTLHQIFMTTTVTVLTVFPGGDTKTTYTATVLLAETVIVGTVPNAYAQWSQK